MNASTNNDNSNHNNINTNNNNDNSNMLRTLSPSWPESCRSAASRGTRRHPRLVVLVV